VEDDIVKVLEIITNQSVSPDIRKVIMMYLDLKMSKEQFERFKEWIKQKGFIETAPVTDDLISRLFLKLGYEVEVYGEGSSKHRLLRYKHFEGNKTISILYTVDDTVTIEEINYFEKF